MKSCIGGYWLPIAVLLSRVNIETAVWSQIGVFQIL